MTEFYARVELRGAPDSETYDRLHKAMSDLKYHNWNYVTGAMKNIPHATYRGDRDSSITARLAYQEIRDALACQRFVFKILVVKAADVWNTSLDWEGV